MEKGVEAVKFRKLGGGFGFFFPKPTREQLGWLPGDLLLLRIVGGKLVVGKVNPARAMPLSQAELDAVRDTDARTK